MFMLLQSLGTRSCVPVSPARRLLRQGAEPKRSARLQPPAAMGVELRAGVCPSHRSIALVGETESVDPTTSDPFKLLIQSIVDYAIYMLDPTGIVTSWN